MHHVPSGGRRLRVGSLFSGYGGLDLAVEHVFHAETIWFSEINEPVARVFAHHWPDAPNLGDITTIDWSDVPRVDILCGGFPFQDVSTVGKQAGLAPGTRSGLWSHMAAAIEALQPEFVVIENVRGLLSAPAVRNLPEGATDARSNPATATPADDASATSDSSRGGESLEQVKARRGTIALSHQILDLALHGPHGSPMQNDESETLWFLIEDVFTAGDATPEPSPDGNTSSDDPPRPPRS